MRKTSEKNPSKIMVNNTLFGNKVSYNGNCPRVNISMSWKNFFRGMKDGVKNFIKVYIPQLVNILSLSLYSIFVLGGFGVAIFSIINYVNGGEDMFGMYPAINEVIVWLAQYEPLIQIGIVVIAIAMLQVVSYPAIQWGRYVANFIWNNNHPSMTKQANEAKAIMQAFCDIINGYFGLALKWAIIAGVVCVVVKMMMA